MVFDLFPNEKKWLMCGTRWKSFGLVDAHKPTAIHQIGTMLARSCDADPEAGLQANALGSYYILEAARLFGVRQVIFASSISVLSATHPNDQTVHDYSPTRPATVYGAAQLFSENLGLSQKPHAGGAHHHLIECIKSVASHKPYFSAKVSGALLESFLAKPNGSDSVLTNRERGVVQLVADGHSNKKSAAVFNISPKAVETHRAAIMRRLDLSSPAGLVRYAIRNKLVEA